MIGKANIISISTSSSSFYVEVNHKRGMSSVWLPRLSAACEASVKGLFERVRLAVGVWLDLGLGGRRERGGAGSWGASFDVRIIQS